MRLVSPRFTAVLRLSPALLLISITIPLLSHLSNHLLFFSLFNTLIFAIFCASRGSSTNDASEGMHFSFLQPFSESEESSMKQEEAEAEAEAEDDDEKDEDDNDDEYRHVQSDGYYEDDDVDDECDESSDDGMTDEYDSELEDTDDSLNTRIEDFIAKVTNGWKEENRREKRDTT